MKAAINGLDEGVRGGTTVPVVVDLVQALDPALGPNSNGLFVRIQTREAKTLDPMPTRGMLFLDTPAKILLLRKFLE